MTEQCKQSYASEVAENRIVTPQVRRKKRPAVAERMRHCCLEVGAASSNPLTTGQIPHLAAL